MTTVILNGTTLAMAFTSVRHVMEADEDIPNNVQDNPRNVQDNDVYMGVCIS